MIRAVIFDCFGVLIEDSLKKLMDEVRAKNPSLGQELTDILHANHHGLLSGADASAQLAVGLGLSPEAYKLAVDGGEVKNNELLRYIVEIKSAYKTAMLSNIGVGSIEKRFNATELQQHFDVVVLSGEVGYAKPEPEIYEIAAERLGVRLDECIFTDDREEFCEAARAVGMQAIVYKDFRQFRTDLEQLLSQSGR